MINDGCKITLRKTNSVIELFAYIIESKYKVVNLKIPDISEYCTILKNKNITVTLNPKDFVVRLPKNNDTNITLVVQESKPDVLCIGYSDDSLTEVITELSIMPVEIIKRNFHIRFTKKVKIVSSEFKNVYTKCFKENINFVRVTITNKSIIFVVYIIYLYFETNTFILTFSI